MTTTTWVGSTNHVSDTIGSLKVSNYDALGRLMTVTQGGTGAVTTHYRYDALENLLGVCQGGSFSGAVCTGGQERKFDYDSLRRLTKAYNPESHHTAYTYDENGNLSSRTDARGWKTSCTYNDANQPVQKTYVRSQGTEGVAASTVSWTWDAASGRLVSVSVPESTTSFLAWDPMGRVRWSRQMTAGITAELRYSYNLAGALESETYPSGRVVTTCYDAAGRPSGVWGELSGTQTTDEVNPWTETRS